MKKVAVFYLEDDMDDYMKIKHSIVNARFKWYDYDHISFAELLYNFLESPIDGSNEKQSLKETLVDFDNKYSDESFKKIYILDNTINGKNKAGLEFYDEFIKNKKAFIFTKDVNSAGNFFSLNILDKDKVDNDPSILINRIREELSMMPKKKGISLPELKNLFNYRFWYDQLY